MSILNTTDLIFEFDRAEFVSLFEFEASESVVKAGTGIFQSQFAFQAHSQHSVEGLAELESGLVFIANEFVNAEPNILEEAIFESGFGIEASAQAFLTGLGLFFSNFQMLAQEVISEPEEFTFDLTIDVGESTTYPGNYIGTQPRLKVDDIEIPVVSATLNDPANASGRTLDIRLAKIEDKAIVGPNALIEFGFGNKIDGIWDEDSFETLMSESLRVNLTHNISWDTSPQDTVQFSAISGATNKLLKSADRDLVIYDPQKVFLKQSDFEILFDNFGRQYLTELKPIGGMRLHQLLREVLVNRCGFTNFRTNLPNYRIARVDVGISQALFEAIAGYIGMFEPVVFEDADVIWIIDTTVALPAGFPAPLTITVSQYRTLSKRDESRSVDALLATFSEDKTDYDYITTSTETREYIEGSFEVRVETQYREYRKAVQPFLILRKEVDHETKEYRNDGVLVRESTVEFDFDSRNNLTQRRLSVDELLPDLVNEPRGDLRMLESERSTERFTWQPHPFARRSQYLARRTLEERALVNIDAENGQLDSPYERKHSEVYQAGNVTLEQTTSLKPTITTVDTADPQKDGSVKIRRMTINHQLNLMVTDDDADPVGDVSMNGLSSQRQRLLVFNAVNASRTGAKIEGFDVGELPSIVFEPLARRRLNLLRSKIGSVEIEYIGYDSRIGKGSVVRAVGRNGEVLGDLIITERAISVSFGSLITTLRGRPI